MWAVQNRVLTNQNLKKNIKICIGAEIFSLKPK
jgi:hypothetical protein